MKVSKFLIMACITWSSLCVKMLGIVFLTTDSDHYNEMTSWNPLCKKYNSLGKFYSPFELAAVPVFCKYNKIMITESSSVYHSSHDDDCTI